MRMEALRRTRLGRSLLALAVNGPVDECYGPEPWIVNHLIICHVLPALSYADIVRDPVLLRFLAENAAPGGFAFTIPAREVMRLSPRGGSPTVATYEQAYRSLLYASPAYHDLLGGMPLPHFMARSQEVAAFCQASVVRGSPPWARVTLPFQSPMNGSS
jgi:hypothetical protein